ncbi:MAG: NAD kinase [Bacteroidaceae bacterium]|nr:NAD kinase [Bacteroidaceae bacterium]MBR1467795.1 NAD kinase [Bacteroidaceae bacterium]
MRKLRFALFGNVYQAKKSSSAQKLLAMLEERQATLLIDRPFHDYLVNELQICVKCDELIEDDDFRADFAISMGGDGTFLDAARRVGDKDMPILGINMGRLGFLSDYQAEDIPSAIDAIYKGDFKCEVHSLLQAQFTRDNDNPAHFPFALNEVAVLKQDNSSMISIRVDINDEYLTTYQADGLIVNTPTGSTGYALSVGGSIMAPGSDTIGLVPVAPHSLTVRPLTLPADTEIAMTVESRSHNFLVSIDGRSESCQEGTRIIIRRAPYTVKVLKRSEGSFFRTLRKKLMWGADTRE